MKTITTIVITFLLLWQTPLAVARTNENVHQQLVAIAQYLERAQGYYRPLTAADTQKIISDGVLWTLAAQEENGHFGYEYAPFTDRYLGGEGMVRQAGTLFMLSEVYRKQSQKEPALAAAIERAADYFLGISLEARIGEYDFLCIKNSPRADICDLGSTSLALIGLLNYLSVVPEKESSYQEVIDQYVSYLLAARLPERGFSSQFDAEDGFGPHESPFYNGEAMLALVRYYQYQPSDATRDLLEELFVYLSEQEHESPLYLWIMAALKDMQKLWPNEAYVAYARDFTEERLIAAAVRRHTTHNYCAPLEGLVSAHSVLEGQVSPDLMKRLGSEIEFWLTKSAYLQLQAAEPYRVVSDGHRLQLLKTPNSALAHGGFLTSEETPTQRIDFTQHCVSAYLQKLVDIEGEEL